MTVESALTALTPVAWWRGADLSAGAIADHSGNGHTATLHGSATLVDGASTDGVQALKLDGASWLSVPDSAAWDFTGPFTVLAWLVLDDADLEVPDPPAWHVGDRSVLSRDDGNGSIHSWGVGLGGASYYKAGGGGGFATDGPPHRGLDAGADRVMAAWVFDGLQVYPYVNGMLVQSYPERVTPGSVSGVADVTAGLVIGAMLAGGGTPASGFLNAAFEHLAIVDGAMTAGDLRVLAAEGIPWPFWQQGRVAQRTGTTNAAFGPYLPSEWGLDGGTKAGDLVLISVTAPADQDWRPWIAANASAAGFAQVATGPDSPGTTEQPSAGSSTEAWPVRTVLLQRYIAADGETVWPYFQSNDTALSEFYSRAVMVGAVYRAVDPAMRVRVEQVLFDVGAGDVGDQAEAADITTGGGDRIVARFYSWFQDASTRPVVAPVGGVQVLRSIEDVYGDVVFAALLDETVESAGAVAGRGLQIDNAGFEWSTVTVELAAAAQPNYLGGTGRVGYEGEQPPGQAPDPSSELPEIPEDPDPDLTETAVYIALEDEADVPDDTPVVETVHDDMGD